jgi:hypothetical protein
MEISDTHHFFPAVLGGLMISLSFLMALIENKAKALIVCFLWYIRNVLRLLFLVTCGVVRAFGHLHH